MVDQPATAPAAAPETHAAVAAVHAQNAASSAQQASAAAASAQAALTTMTTKAEAHASNWVAGHKLEAVAIVLGALALFALFSVLAVK
jgi:hypothetical protein